MKIIGHETQLGKLKKIVDTNKVGNAYIFEGIEGIGKYTIAKEFARGLLCISTAEKPCEMCTACNLFNETNDLIIVKPDGNIIKVDDIRNLKDELMLKPTISNRKVAIINNAELMNEQAQNALLKILEEPPEYVTIILVTSSKEKLLYTIKSRCTLFKFNPLKNEEIKEFFNKDISEDLLTYSRGSIGAIIKLQESNNTDIVEKLVNSIKYTSLIDMMREVNTIKEDKYVKDNLQSVLGYFMYWYYQDMKENRNNNVEAIKIVEETKSNILRNANVDIALDRMMINLWKWGRTCKKL